MYKLYECIYGQIYPYNHVKFQYNIFSESVPLPAAVGWSPTSCLHHRCEAARLEALGRGCSVSEAEEAADAVADYEVYILDNRKL